MRTTLNVDDDILLTVKELAHRDGRSAGAVLSELARKGLSARAPDTTAASDGFYGFHPLPARGRPVTNELVNRLRDEEPASTVPSS